MNTLITIIIFLFIILSAVKNVQEANRKSGEIKLPPQKPVEPRPEQSTDASPRPKQEWMPTPSEPLPYPAPGWPMKPAPEPVPPAWEKPGRLPEETLRRLEEKYRRIAETPLPEETVGEEEVFEKEDNRPATRRTAVSKVKIPRRKPARIQIPSLRGAAVANGIIMQEILGPPVGLRQQGRSYW
jgi:hypothetical protein